MALENSQLSKGPCVPHSRGVVVCARDDAFSIPTDRDIANRIRVAFQKASFTQQSPRRLKADLGWPPMGASTGCLIIACGVRQSFERQQQCCASILLLFQDLTGHVREILRLGQQHLIACCGRLFCGILRSFGRCLRNLAFANRFLPLRYCLATLSEGIPPEASGQERKRGGYRGPNHRAPNKSTRCFLFLVLGGFRFPQQSFAFCQPLALFALRLRLLLFAYANKLQVKLGRRWRILWATGSPSLRICDVGTRQQSVRQPTTQLPFCCAL